MVMPVNKVSGAAACILRKFCCWGPVRHRKFLCRISIVHFMPQAGVYFIHGNMNAVAHSFKMPRVVLGGTCMKLTVAGFAIFVSYAIFL